MNAGSRQVRQLAFSDRAKWIACRNLVIRPPQEVRNAGGCQWPVEVIALCLFTTCGDQEIDVRLGLDAFGDDFNFKRMGEIDRRPNDRRTPRIGWDRGNESLSDFQPADRVFGQICKRRIAGAKIVDSDADTYFSQTVEYIVLTSRSVYTNTDWSAQARYRRGRCSIWKDFPSPPEQECRRCGVPPSAGGLWGRRNRAG